MDRIPSSVSVESQNVKTVLEFFANIISKSLEIDTINNKFSHIISLENINDGQIYTLKIISSNLNLELDNSTVTRMLQSASSKPQMFELAQIYLNTGQLTPEITTLILKELESESWSLEQVINLVNSLLVRMNSKAYIQVKKWIKQIILSITDEEEIDENAKNSSKNLLNILFAKDLQIGSLKLNQTVKTTPLGFPAYTKIKISDLANQRLYMIFTKLMDNELKLDENLPAVKNLKLLVVSKLPFSCIKKKIDEHIQLISSIIENYPESASDQEFVSLNHILSSNLTCCRFFVWKYCQIYQRNTPEIFSPSLIQLLSSF